MKRFVKHVVMLAAAALISSSAFGAISYSEDFESYDPDNPDALASEGWLVFGNVFANFPTCGDYIGGYGPFPAPNSGSAFSNIVDGAFGQALNVFSDYNNGDHAFGNCIESNVFQERAVTAADAETYTFRFFTQAPGELGENVSTYGFIKLINPATGFNTEVFLTTSTQVAGWKSIEITLTPEDDGKLVQWGFASVASNYLPSGRWYDQVSFTLTSDLPPGYESDSPVPIPLWAFLAMAGLIGYVGGSRLLARKT
jgi:hypothetical protein